MENSNLPAPPKKRSSNFELLRIISMLMIISWHYTQHAVNSPSGSDWALITVYHSINSYFALLLGSWGQLGVTLFIMISSWFICDRSTNHTKKAISIALQTWLLSIIIFVSCIMFKAIDFNLNIFMREVTTPLIKQYWFITCYCFYLILVPYINRFLISNLNDIKKLCVFLTFAVPIYNNIFIGPFGEISWFIYIHIFIYYLKHTENNFFEKHYLGGGIILFLLILSMLTAFFFLEPHIHNTELIKYILDNLSGRNIFILLFSICIFYYAKNINMGNIRIINILSKPTLIIYILHENVVFHSTHITGTSALLWDRILHADKWFHSPCFFFHMVGSSLFIYLAGTILYYFGAGAYIVIKKIKKK